MRAEVGVDEKDYRGVERFSAGLVRLGKNILDWWLKLTLKSFVADSSG
jgi:hypothetical protein